MFLLRHVYLSGVYEPLWASGRLAATAAGNLLVLCDDSSAMAGNIQNVSTLTLGPIRRSTDPAAAWTKTLMTISSAEPGRAVVITDLDSDLEDEDLTHAKLELLGELVNDPARTVVVLSQSHPARLLDSVRPGQHGPDRALWQQLLRTFVVVDWRDDTVRQAPGRVCEVLDGEGRIDRFVRRICDDIRAVAGLSIRIPQPCADSR